MLVTGNINRRWILSSLSFFDIAEGEHKSIEVKIRKGPAARSGHNRQRIISLFDLPAFPPDRFLGKGG
jgi:hypothetical protein